MHGVAMRLGVGRAAHVEKTLHDAYAARGGERVEEASAVFERMKERNAVAWTTMIVPYTRWGKCGSRVTEDASGIKQTGIQNLQELENCL